MPPPCVSQLADMTRLERLQLEHNELEYVSTGTTATLQAKCKRLTDGMECAGMPPHSCNAFGEDHRVRTDDPDFCIRCYDMAYSVVMLSGLFLVFLVFLGAYAYLVTKYPGSMNRWVSSGAIFITHLQTLEIISNMRIAWPGVSNDHSKEHHLLPMPCSPLPCSPCPRLWMRTF